MKAEDIWKIWDEVIGVDVGIDPVPFAEAVLNAAPTGDIEHVAQVLACEIECSIFEQHVAPALEIALKALSPTQGADKRCDYCGNVLAKDLSCKSANCLHGTQGADVRPVAWRARGYAQFKTGKPSEWRYYDGSAKPNLNNPECCDIEALYATCDAAPSDAQTDEEIDALVLRVLAELQSQFLWDAVTFESGPYSINKVDSRFTYFAKRLIAASAQKEKT